MAPSFDAPSDRPPDPGAASVPASVPAPAPAPALAERVVRTFFARVWAPPHDLDALAELVVEDYVLHTGGTTVVGRAAFRAWLEEFQRVLPGGTNEVLDVFADPTGARVVARWVCTGRNQGIFGLPPDGRTVSFSGIAIWRLRGARLAECWVERGAFELVRALTRQEA